jgi:hypothetical protein
MGTLLRVPSLVLLALLATRIGAAEGNAAAAERDDSHRLRLGVDLHAISTSSGLEAWTQGGLGKLRFDDSSEPVSGNRIAFDYSGRLRTTLWAHVVADFVDDASTGFDLSEAYLVWRPIPKSPNQHQFRFGAFYPPLSLENSGVAWSSPYSISFSAINTWLGEEIRPFGLEWTLRRRLGGPSSPHQLAAFASAFYGNDPAGTLLFWRGWSLHDRQTRLNDKLPIPPLPAFGPTGITGYIEQPLEPFVELDSRPGFYAGLEWTLGRRAKLQVARYDNRADPHTFDEGVLGWDTRFSTLGLQLSLPAKLGLIVQSMQGETTWIPGASPDGDIGPLGVEVTDYFDSSFLLLTRTFKESHRVTLRWDSFDVDRDLPRPMHSDGGSAQTVAYRYTGLERLTFALEWLRISSTRDLWSVFYGLPRHADERQIRAQISWNLDL